MAGGAQGGQAMGIRLKSAAQWVSLLGVLLALLGTVGPAAAQGKPIRIGEVNSSGLCSESRRNFLLRSTGS